MASLRKQDSPSTEMVRRARRAHGYAVSVRGDTPADLVERVTAAHATALLGNAAQPTAHQKDPGQDRSPGLQR